MTASTSTRSMTPGTSMRLPQRSSSGSFPRYLRAASGKRSTVSVQAVVGPAAPGPGGRVQANHRRAQRGSDVGRPRVGRYQHRGAVEQRHRLRQRVLAHQVDDRPAHGGLDGGPGALLRFAGPARQDHPHAEAGGRMVRHRGIALHRPVAQDMAGAGADHQRRLVAGQLSFGPGPVFAGAGQAPQRGLDLDAQRPGKFQEALDLMLEWDAGHLVVDEPLVAITRTRPVPAQANGRFHQPAEQVGAQRHLHVQQKVE